MSVGLGGQPKQNSRVMFVHELCRHVSIIAAVPKGRTSLVFPQSQPQARIRVPGRGLQCRRGDMADDLAAPTGEPKFSRGGAAPAAGWCPRSGQRQQTVDRGEGIRGHGELLSSAAKITETDSRGSHGSHRPETPGGNARGMGGPAAARDADRWIEPPVAAFPGTGAEVFTRAQSTWGEPLAGDADCGIPRCVQRIGSATELGSDVWR